MPSPSAGAAVTQKFGQGAIAGVAAPESAANAATCSGFIPLLTLGLPDNVVMALILGAFMLHGVTPGPTLMMQHPQMFWAIVTSMFIGNCILIVTMLPMIGLLSKITLIPNRHPCSDHRAGLPGRRIRRQQQSGRHRHDDGVRDARLSHDEIRISARADGLAFVLGPIMETSLRQSLIMSSGDFLIFWSSPVAAVLMSVLVFIVGRAGGARAGLFYRRRASGTVESAASLIVPGLVLLALLAPVDGTHAQDYPTKPVTLIVPYPPGGRTDLCGPRGSAISQK